MHYKKDVFLYLETREEEEMSHVTKDYWFCDYCRNTVEMDKETKKPPFGWYQFPVGGSYRDYCTKECAITGYRAHVENFIENVLDSYEVGIGS